MTAHTIARAALFAGALLAGLLLALFSQAAPAQADNCQPEELVVRMTPGGGQYQSPLPDEVDPRCVGSAQAGCDNQANPGTCSAGVISTAVDRTLGHGSRLQSGETLRAGGSMKSDDGQYSLVMGYDGNLVHYGPGGVIWESGTFGHIGARLIMQLDGNLVIYTTGNYPVWSTNTFAGPSTLVVQNDSNLVVYGPGGPVWSRY